MSAPGLQTKNVFLTGGAQGLGKSYLDSLLAAGASVVFGDINPTVGAATEQELAQKHGQAKVKFIELDVTDGAKFEAAFQSAVERLGHVDLMVNNAGFMVESLWEKMIQLNYAGVVRGTFLAYEHMRKDRGGRGGRIVNISSEFVKPGSSRLVDQRSIICATWHPFSLVEASQAKSDNVTVERVQSAFMKLVLLQEMNGAILYVPLHEMNFYKMEKVNLGDSWPVKVKDGASPSTASS
ncbi:hypothetical protein EGW08_006684 [Elysia chlorotica]|uniref:15-hydroxyprostaglandin dehydrogenase [NAD(+)] n=1 Tax=Elysia chlorotica TaxID=188477 RepID=A0A433TVD1_ELYCH|nr:hypothetical protein EGW08_006684 [Elysia chlorotica]